MRRLVALFVLALLGATLFGASNHSSGVAVSGSTLSPSTFRAELAVIATDLNLQCHVAALDPVSFAAGAGGASISATGASAWANLRVEGLAIDQYVKAHFQFHPTAASLALARSSLEAEMTQAVTNRQYHCSGTSAQAIDAMPAEMRSAQVEAQAASIFLISQLNSTIAINTASLQAYYTSHLSSYQSICVSVAVVAPAKVLAFQAAQKAGASVATLARTFSVDGSASRGGSDGCFGPTSQYFSGVRTDTATTALNTFPVTPLSISYNGGTYAFFVAPTKRTTTPFAQAESAVLADVQNANATKATAVKASILYQAAVAIDPSFGRWGLKSTGPSVFAPATPRSADVGPARSITALSTAGASTYK